MITLSELSNQSVVRKKSKRVGRGIGSGLGKTAGRGQKGAGSRSGYKRRHGKEGGRVPLFKKLPTRGFTRGRFKKEIAVINLGQIEEIYEAGESVNVITLVEKGYLSGSPTALKVLGDGEIKKNVKIIANAFSKSAIEKMDKLGISYSVL